MWWIPLAFAADPAVKLYGERIPDPGRWLERERRPPVQDWWRAQSEATEVWFAENTAPEPIRAWLAADRERERPLSLSDALDGTLLWSGIGDYLPAPHKDGNAGPGPRYTTRLLVERGGSQVPVPHDDARELCVWRLLTPSLLLFGEREPFRPLAPRLDRPCALTVWDVETGGVRLLGDFERPRGVSPTPDGAAVRIGHQTGRRSALSEIDLASGEADTLYRGRRAVAPTFLADGTFVGTSEFRENRKVPLRLVYGDDLEWLPRMRDAAFVGGRAGDLLVRTDWYGAGGNVVRVDPERPWRYRWRVLVGERPGMDLAHARLHGDTLVTVWRRDGLVQVEEAPYDGGPGHRVATGPITAASLWGTNRDRAVLALTSPVSTRWLQRDAGGALTPLGTATWTDGVFSSVLVRSADGTQVPVSLVSPPGDPPSGGRPALLNVYGGFEHSQRLELGAVERAFLAAGGVVGVVHTRGGRERGDAWHDDAIEADHPRTYEDLIAAARGLVDLGIAAPGKVAVTGGSNGGLTVAAAVARDPEAFGAAIPVSGVYDLLRARKFGRWWPDEYGRRSKPEQAAVLRAEAPVYRTPAGPLPPLWVRTGERDPVVAPGHSYKLVAAWQTLAGGPVLLSVDPWGTHGGRTTVNRDLKRETLRDGTSVSDARAAQTLAFLFAVFDMALPSE